jgi:hypothetical protein
LLDNLWGLIDIYASYYSDEASEPDVDNLESAGLDAQIQPITEGNDEDTWLPE